MYLYILQFIDHSLYYFCFFSGIQTSQDAKFYGISAKFEKAFSNKGTDLVIQFSVKHEQTIDCGGGYVKVSLTLKIQPEFLVVYWSMIFIKTNQ